MALTQEELKKKIAEIEEEAEPAGKKRKYKGYKRGFTRKYIKYGK